MSQEERATIERILAYALVTAAVSMATLIVFLAVAIMVAILR